MLREIIKTFLFQQNKLFMQIYYKLKRVKIFIRNEKSYISYVTYKIYIYRAFSKQLEQKGTDNEVFQDNLIQPQNLWKRF